jgi:hypothetical protein
MAVGTEAAVQAVEIETFTTSIPSLIPKSKTLYGIANAQFQKDPVSFSTTGGATNRPSFRVPFKVQSGSAISQGTGDGDFMGTGNASDYGSFTVSPVWHYSVCQITALAQAATNGKKKGIIEYKAEELKNSFDSTMSGIEGIMYSDGSGLLSPIPSSATINSQTTSSSITGQGLRAMAVTDNQVLQVFPSEGGASRGTITVLVTSPQTSAIYFTGSLVSTSGVLTNGTNLTSNVLPGDYLMINGSTGAAGSSTQTSVLGTQAWNNSATTGSLAGYSRSTYPTRVSTPAVNLNGGSIQASLSARLQAIVGRALGDDNEVWESGFYLVPEDQKYAIAQSNYYNKELAYHESNSNGSKGSVPDMSYKMFQETYGGRAAKLSYVQPAGRLDLILAKNWHLAQLFELRTHDYGGGTTVVPVPGSSGYYNANQFSYEASFNLVNSAPVQGVVVTNASQPFIS